MIEVQGCYTHYGKGSVQEAKKKWETKFEDGKILVEIDDNEMYSATVDYGDSAERVVITKTKKKVVDSDPCNFWDSKTKEEDKDD